MNADPSYIGPNFDTERNIDELQLRLERLYSRLDIASGVAFNDLLERRAEINLKVSGAINGELSIEDLVALGKVNTSLAELRMLDPMVDEILNIEAAINELRKLNIHELAA